MLTDKVNNQQKDKHDKTELIDQIEKQLEEVKSIGHDVDVEKQKEHELFSEAVQLYHDQRLVGVYKKRLNRLKNKLID